MNDPAKKKDFIFLCEVHEGNPNGNPVNNAPRVDYNDRLWMTDVSLKRRIRDYVNLTEKGKVYIRSNIFLREERDTLLGKDIMKFRDVIDKMIKEYIDARWFGVVAPANSNLQIKRKNGNLQIKRENAHRRGPICMFTLRCVHDVDLDTQVGITRICRESNEKKDDKKKYNKENDNKEDSNEEEKNEEKGRENGTFGEKYIVPYSLFLGKGTYSPTLSKKSQGVYDISEDDLKLFWQALVGNFELDFSASRGYRAFVILYVFTHSNELGKLSRQELYSRVKVEYQGKTKYPESINDFKILTNFGDLKEKGVVVEIIRGIL